MSNGVDTEKQNQEYIKNQQYAGAILKAIKDKEETAKLYKPEYNQIYFPYDGKFANTFRLGSPSLIGSNGHTIPGKHTYDTCKLNAAQHAANKTSISYNTDLMASDSSGNYMQIRKVQGDFTINPNVFETNANANATTTTSYSVEIKQYLMASEGGARNCLPVFANMPPNSTAALWTHSLTATTVLNQAVVYIKNGNVQNTLNDNRDFTVYKGVPFPVTIRFLANSETDAANFISLVQKTSNPVIQIKSKNGVLKMVQVAIPTAMPNSTYFNLNTATGECTILDSPDFTYETERVIFSQALQSDVSFVGLTTKGFLYQYSGTSAEGAPIEGIAYNTTNQPVIDSSYKLRINENTQKVNLINTSTKISQTLINLQLADVSLNANQAWLTGIPGVFDEPVNVLTSERVPGTSIPAIQITKTRALVSENGLYKMYIDNGALKVVASIASPNRAFSVMPDYRSGRVFLADQNDSTQMLLHVPNSHLKPGNTYTAYKGMYPLTQLQSNYNIVYDADCQAKCNESNCNHYYDIALNNGKKACAIYKKNNIKTGIDGTYLFAPEQTEQRIIKNTTLYVANKQATTGDYTKDRETIDKYPYITNGYNKMNDKILEYNLASFEYDGTNELRSFIGGDTLVNNTIGSAFGAPPSGEAFNRPLNVYMKNEGFETLTKEQQQTIQNNALKQIDEQLKPLMSNYLNNQAKVVKNRVDISNSIAAIEKDVADQSSDAPHKSGVKNNEYYDFSGNIIHSLEKDRTIVPALLKDQQLMLEEQNNLYMVSTITVATLLVTAIVMASR